MNWVLVPLTIAGSEFQPNDHYSNNVVARVIPPPQGISGQIMLQMIDGGYVPVADGGWYNIERPVIGG